MTLAVEQVDLIANGIFIVATLVFEGVAQRAEKHELTGGETVRTSSGAIVGEVDDPTPVDGTIEAVPQRKATSVRGTKTLVALAIAGTMLTGCAHLDGWAEADRAIQAIDGDRLAACQARDTDIARCMGMSAGGSLLRHLLTRGAEIVTRLIVARSGGGAEADSLTEAEAHALAVELEHIAALVEAHEAQ